ncbi:vascular cell adhesion protein 1-like [Nerophis ophidion]|uniref:vascular cell adhesion protein 1-like n=1 Tax=Nerophis ophidion TaxID=159077 RepID=UPI002ADF972E|nr:vascular cell adhesion protein 1-like [Nerophis ophidion]
MMRKIILLLGLTSGCVCGFEVNVTQASYSAKENDNITLRWTFTSHRNMLLSSLWIHCEIFAQGKAPVHLFRLQEGVEVPAVYKGPFTERLQSDMGALNRGKIILRLFRLRLEDSGLYRCQVTTREGRKSAECQVIVTASNVVNEGVNGTLASPPPQDSDDHNILRALLLTAIAAAVVAALAAGYLLSLIL